MVRLAWAFSVLLAFASASAEPASPAKSTRTGRFEVKFIEASDLASQKESQKRFRWKEKPQEFRLEDETFQVFVPDEYQPDGTWGAFVWISPTENGFMCPEPWLDVLARRKLIWIGADRSGNNRLIDHRVRLAVEAALQVQNLYAIDPDRVYAAGFSGGGKIAGMCAIVYADVFRGTFSICGPTFYRNIPTGVKKDELYPQAFYAPPAKMLKVAKEVNRHVLFSGDDDFNLQPTRQKYALGYEKDKFRNILLLIQPGLAHQLPSAEYLEKGIEFLDRPPAATQPARK